MKPSLRQVGPALCESCNPSTCNVFSAKSDFPSSTCNVFSAKSYFFEQGFY